MSIAELVAVARGGSLRATGRLLSLVEGPRREEVLARLPEKLNLVLLSVDTLRYDLGYLGHPKPISPNRHRLRAASGPGWRATGSPSGWS